MKKFILFIGSTLAFVPFSFGQGILPGSINGDLMTNLNFFQRDTAIKASDNPLYDNLLSGGESWLNLRYSQKDFNAFIRMDIFNNSNLMIPTLPTSGFGIGAWGFTKDFQNLSITGGYIYDQIGSGIIFRAYEDRGLLIDNALVGLRLKYKLNNNLTIKGFTGQQKFLFTRYEPIIKALNIEGSYNINNKVFLNPGVGVLNRTLDKGSMDALVNRTNALPLPEREEPKYNMYSGTIYNTLSVGGFSWYAEAAMKSREAINNYNGDLEFHPGSLFYSTIGYATEGIALTFAGKRTENFSMRTSPSENSNFGMLNWQPIIAQIRPQRLIARYTPQSLDWSETALSGNIMYVPNDDYDLSGTYTHINTNEGLKLYREAHVEANIRSIKHSRLALGLQYMEYNQDYYQFKPGKPMVKAITPFVEFVYKLAAQKSISVQAQYMNTKEDFGSWAFLQLEYSLAPRWSFAISDMYNIKPAHTGDRAEHYFNFFVAHTRGAHRFTAAWVKQVEGVNCTGGVCRYEPAFNGLKVGITSTF